MRCVWFCSQTFVFVTLCSARSLEKYPMDGTQIRLPKCCENYETYKISEKMCTETNETVNYNHYYFDSNETHINTDRVEFTPTFYKISFDCKPMWVYNDTEMLGFIFNSSVIWNSFLEYADQAIISPLKYCVFEQYGRIAVIECIDTVSSGKVIVIYLPFLILSTFCYFFSAFIYCSILKVRQIQRKCFIGYAISMGVTLMFLIILQTVDAKGGCEAIGSLFFFSMMSSFVWLVCLCFELILMVRNLKESTNENRTAFYLAASLTFPCFLLLLNLIPHGKPYVPNSFIKWSGRSVCKFKETDIPYFFISIGVLMVSSLILLGYNFYLMGRMETKYKNHFNWLENKSKFKYMTISCSLIWLTSAVWIVDMAIRSTNTIIVGNPDVFDVIEALQGVFALAIFVTDRYTRREIYAKLVAGSDSNSEHRRYNRTIRWLTKKFSAKTSTDNPDGERIRTE